MSTLSQARAAVQAQLAAIITGLTVYSTIPGTISTPAAIVAPNTANLADYEQVMSSDLVLWYIRVVLLTGMVSLATAQDTMDGLLSTTGTTSVTGGFRADPSLGGQVEWAEVKTAQRYGTVTYNGVDYLGCELSIEVSC